MADAYPAPGVLRVEWVPGSDRLRGTCHCGAVHVADGPVEVWEWLLGHRDALLTEDERAAHDTMFPCVSRAACPTLVLDL